METTPDLTNEFHPVPKPPGRVKKVKKALGAGKRTKAWQIGLQGLKTLFQEKNILFCEIRFEGCKRDNYLGFAHVKRRVNYDEKELVDPHHVVLACQPCHHIVDFEMPKDKSERFLGGIVALRGW